MNFLGKNIEKIVIFGLRLRSMMFAHLSYLSMASTRGHRGDPLVILAIKVRKTLSFHLPGKYMIV